MQEIWKDIKGFKSFYQISNIGRVKSLKRDSKNHANIVDRILQPKIDRYGYLCVTLVNSYIKRSMLVHRLVAEAFVPNLENKPEVNHKNGIKINCYTNNLEWATSKENTNHRDNVLNKHCRGEKHGQVKLTSVDVSYILQSSMKQRELAEMFSVTQACISLIKTRQNWSHLGKD